MSAVSYLDRAQAFIASVPWRQVQPKPYGPTQKAPDPHQYVIREWDSVDDDEFVWFVSLVREHGYRGRYTTPYQDPATHQQKTMINRYLEIDGWAYWYIRPHMLNRCRADLRQHERLPD